MGEMFSEVGDLMFTLVIGYIGALEFLYVVRHLYHWTFRHATGNEGENNEEGLKHLQDSMRRQLAVAEAKESEAIGLNAMQDGVLYKDGFRIEPPSEQKGHQERRHSEIEAELARQQKIEEETRIQLARAEAELEKQRLEAAALAEQQEAEQKLLAAERACEEAQAEEERKRAEAEESAKRILEAERQRELEQRQLGEERERNERARIEEVENAKRILEAERQKEIERQLEEERERNERARIEEEEKRILEAECQRELEQRQLEEEERERKERARIEEEENAKRILEAERQRDVEQRQIEEERERNERARIEEEENAKHMLEAERQKEQIELLREQAAEEQRSFVEHEQKENENNFNRMLEAELRQQEEQRAIEEAAESEHLNEQPLDNADLSDQARLLLEAELEQERKQRVKEENARKFLEAEEKMVAELQRQMDAAEKMQKEQNSIDQDVLAELERQMDAADAMQRQQHAAEQDVLEGLERQMQSTEQMQQRQLPSLNQQISIVEEPCIKRNVSSISNSDADERVSHTLKTQFGQKGNDSFSMTTKFLHFPDVADDASSVEPTSSQKSSFSTQPSDEVTTGTEETVKAIGVPGIELEREAPDGEDNTPEYTDEYLRSLDGIKQRPLVREDGTGRRRAFKKRRSSGSSTSSRDSRMSRDEEIKMFTSLEEEEKLGEEDFSAIKYSSEPTLKVKSHHRRHKRSPAKDAKTSEDRASLEMLNEENANPWGEIVPEHYKDTEFWKREKAISIDEEVMDHEPLAPRKKEKDGANESATNVPKASSFEEADEYQHQEALEALQKQQSKEVEDNSKEMVGATLGDENKNLQTSQNTEANTTPACSTSPRLRRSPRIDEIDQYEERWKETADKKLPVTVTPPTITLDTAPWRDERGLLMEGISDFYDFTASINPSRSRSTSRATTPTVEKPSVTFPKNVSYSTEGDKTIKCQNQPTTNEIVGMLELCDDVGNFEVIHKGAVMEFVETLNKRAVSTEYFESAADYLTQNLRNVADEPETRPAIELMPTIFVEAADNNSTPAADLSRSHSRSRSRSRSPLPTADNIERSLERRRTKRIQHNEEISEKLKETMPDGGLQFGEATQTVDNMNRDNEVAREDINLLVESLRSERARSTSRGRSPLPTFSNIQRSLDVRREKLIQHNNEICQKLEQSQVAPDKAVEAPIISIELIENNTNVVIEECDELSGESMAALVQTLRIARSKSRSKTPMRVEVKYVYEYENAEDETYKVSVPRPRSRSVTPSRSPIIVPVQDNTPNSASHETTVEVQSPDHSETSLNFAEYVIVTPETLENLSDNYDFHQLLNLEGSSNKTLSKNTEEIETDLALKQRLVDEESLDKLRTANEEVELRTISPACNIEHHEAEHLDKFEHTIDQERLRQLKCTPTTPDYDRTISKEWEDIQRIKEASIASGFKRSTYVGESLDNGSEFENLRRETADFQRSQSRSRSPACMESAAVDRARKIASDARQIQSDILAEITGVKQEESHGAKPKNSSYERSLSKEIIDTQRIKEAMLNSGFQRSTYAGESLDMSAQPEMSAQLEDLRQRTAEFQRSQSRSRSPLDSQEALELQGIDAEASRRQFQDRILDEIERTNVNFQDFSRHLNADFLDSERRASDSMLIQKPEIIFQFEDIDFNLDMDIDPEEYHHFRRFSLYQEPPVEEYPNDDESDYMFVSNAGVFTTKGTGSWMREDYCSDSFEKINREEATAESVSKSSSEKLLQEGVSKVGDNTALDMNVPNSTQEELPKGETAEVAALVEVKAANVIEEGKILDAHQDNENVASSAAIVVKDEVVSAAHEWEGLNVIQADMVELAQQEDELATAMQNEEIMAALQEGELEADEDLAYYLEDEDTDGSEDERRTVVDVEDEIEEDIGDYNDRGPTDESHHEQSECEEADRLVDRYADKRAEDWHSIEDVQNALSEHARAEEERVSKGAAYDSDSFAIDQIYDEAIRNRKQSGILRDYDCILQDMQKSFSEKTTEGDHYALWAKTRELERSNSMRANGIDSSVGLLESEQNDGERRYLGDAIVSARSATRLRSRYGYSPVLLNGATAEIEVDLNYKPKREYNWRKNFKLDEPEVDMNGNSESKAVEAQAEDHETVDTATLDLRKFSLGGESITLFSRSPDREILPEVVEEEATNHYFAQELEPTLDTPIANEVVPSIEATEKKQKTKKKSKKKTRKESKGSIEAYPKDDDDSENQIPCEYSRRSSSLQMETDSPKRKSRSRRSSRSSLVNEDSIELLSPRGSIGYAEVYEGDVRDTSSSVTSTIKKKTKKRKKAKETFMHEPEIKEEYVFAEAQAYILPEPLPLSTAISPTALSMNVLSSLSPEKSVCVTPASIESDTNVKIENDVPATAIMEAPSTPPIDTTTSSTVARTAARIIESFDILKDGNFYPLF